MRPRGNSIMIDFRYRHVRCREVIKLEPTPKNIKIAENMLGAIKHDIALNKFIYANYFPNSNKVYLFGERTKTNMTIAEALDWWWKEAKDLHRPKTQKTYQGNMKNHIIPKLGLLRLTEVTSNQIKYWRDGLALSKKGKNNALTTLRRMFAEAYSDNLINENVLLRIKNLKVDKIDYKPLNPSEVDAVLNYLTGAVKYFYQFSIWTGLSTGEQLGLKWGDINFNACVFHVRRQIADGKYLQDTKNKFRTRRIELLHPAYEALKALMPDDFFENREKYNDQWVFTNPLTNDYWRIDPITYPWKKALKKLNIEYRRPYYTRHTFASIMLTACIPFGWIRQQMGHANMRMLEEVYAHWLEESDDIREWLLKKTQNGHNGPQFTSLFLTNQ